MTQLITVTEVVRAFGDIIGRVYYKGEEFDIKKGSHIVAHLSPAKYKRGLSMADLEKVFETCPSLSLEEKESFKEDIAFIQDNKGELIDKWD